MGADNWDTEPAWTYHERTKHTVASVRSGARHLDWENRPEPFKQYVALEPLRLPDGRLARLLRWGAGVVRRRALPGGDEYHFRTYSSAGALYPVEVYLACADLDGLPAGLYHFDPLEPALRQLRPVDVRARLAVAADADGLAGAEAILVVTGILWRTAWKYEARGYRHLYWDAGTMLANLLALAAAERVEARVLTGFVDDDVNELVGVDGAGEAALALLAFGRAASAEEQPALPALETVVAPISSRPGEYPDAAALHRGSSLQSREEVRRYRAGAASTHANAEPLGADRPLEDVLRRRGSVRNFARDPIARLDLERVLAAAAGPIPADVLPESQTYLIANAVDRLEPGAYRFAPPDEFDLLRSGHFRRKAAFLCLEQPLGGLAAATHFLVADLEQALARHGSRGYRAAQLEAGIRVGRMYLGAVALGLGATASTFYDDEVTRFFGVADGETMLALAAGRRL